MWNLVCYRPDRDALSDIVTLSDHPDLLISAVVVDAPDTPAASIAELAGFPVRFELTPDLLDADRCILLVPEAATPSELPTLSGVSADRVMTASALQRFLSDGAVTAVETGSVAPGDPPARRAPAAEPVREPAAAPDSDAPSGAGSRDVRGTLTRIEKSLEREALLPWLLGLASRAVDADGGSLMLLDPYTDELYIGASTGLSRDTVIETRTRLGEGIAGKIAAGTDVELLSKTIPGAPRGDRPGIASAICAPLFVEDLRLGVLNLVRDGGRAPFDRRDLAEIRDLSPRLSRILYDADGVQQSREARDRRRIDMDLRALSDSTADPETELAGWSRILAAHLRAQHVSLAFLRDDGTLLIGEGVRDGDIRIGDSDQHAPAWDDVLETGRCLFARREPDGPDGTDMSIVILPVGKNPPRGGMSACFETTGQGHAFRKRAASIAALLERRFKDYKHRHIQRARIARLKALAARLGEPGFGDARDPDAMAAGLGADLGRFTGARSVLRVDTDGAADLVSGRPVDIGTDPAAALDMLAAAADDGWRVSSLMTKAPGRTPLSILALPLREASGTPGFILIGKRRLHILDATLFDDFDAGLARRLAAAWFNRGHGTPAEAGPRPTVRPSANPSDPIPRPRRETGPDPLTHPADGLETPGREELARIVSREISRSTRYHVSFSLSTFRFLPPVDPDLVLRAGRELEGGLRESDHMILLDGTILVLIAPEEAHAVSQLEKRSTRIICAASGLVPEKLDVRRVVFPGRFETADAMLRQVLGEAP